MENKYIIEELKKTEKNHDWNYNIKAVFSGINGKSKTLDIPYKDWLKIKKILINSSLN